MMAGNHPINQGDIRGLYVSLYTDEMGQNIKFNPSDKWHHILKNDEHQKKLLTFIRDQRINTLSFYNLPTILADGDLKASLKSFMKEARKKDDQGNGVTHFFAIGSNVESWERIKKFNAKVAKEPNGCKFTGLLTEIEYWNFKCTFINENRECRCTNGQVGRFKCKSKFTELLNKIEEWNGVGNEKFADLLTEIENLKSERTEWHYKKQIFLINLKYIKIAFEGALDVGVYVTPHALDADMMTELTHRGVNYVFIANYAKDPEKAFSKCKECFDRVKTVLDGEQNNQIRVISIFSAEGDQYRKDPTDSFMGHWISREPKGQGLSNHATVDKAYEQFIDEGKKQFDETFPDSYSLGGFQFYDYYFLSRYLTIDPASLPPDKASKP